MGSMRAAAITVTAVLGLTIASFFTTLTPSPQRLVYERDPLTTASIYCRMLYMNNADLTGSGTPLGTVDLP